jgi:hypothetical protein
MTIQLISTLAAISTSSDHPADAQAAALCAIADGIAVEPDATERERYALAVKAIAYQNTNASGIDLTEYLKGGRA